MITNLEVGDKVTHILDELKAKPMKVIAKTAEGKITCEWDTLDGRKQEDYDPSELKKGPGGGFKLY